MNPHAIIVVGNDRRFIDTSTAFARYLHASAGCRVSMIRGNYLKPEQLAERLRGAIRRAGRQPLLVAYFGHGMPDHWSFAKEHQNLWLTFPFDELAAILATHAGPLTVINDTCHANGLQPFLEKAGLAERCMLIAACEEEALSYGGLGRELAASWRKGESFETITETEQICHIDMTPYVPPWHVHLGRWWLNWRIRFANRFRRKKHRRPEYIFMNSPPNGWAKHVEKVTTRTIGLRWGAAHDHLFFPRKP